MSNEPRVFHPTNLGLTKEQIVEITETYADTTEDGRHFSVDDIIDAEAERFACLYYDMLVECAGRGDDFLADAMGSAINDWLTDLGWLAKDD